MSKRLDAIAAFRERVVAMHETLARTLTREVGKPIRQSRNELNGLLPRIDFFLAEAGRRAARGEGVRRRRQKLEERITHEPLGVIANISAWNYPYFVGGNVFVPALLAGNAVLYKPSEFATLTGLHIAELLHEAGVPDDVFVPVIGDGATGAALLRQPVDGVFFTGSYATGAKIAAAAGRRMIKVQLELGGKDPVYVCDDVDVEEPRPRLADGAFYNTGQSCCSVERIYVHESDPRRLRRRVRRRGQGLSRSATRWTRAPTSAPSRAGRSSTCCRSRSPTRSEGRELADRRQASSSGKGNWFEPTVFDRRRPLDGADARRKLRPIIGIQKVEDDAEAVAMMNDTDYGLTAGVYTHGRERARRILCAGDAGLGLLELLRPRQPAAAVVGRRALGHRPDAVDLRHPDVHAAEGLAPARARDQRPDATRAFALGRRVGLRRAPCSSAAAAYSPAASRSSSVPRRPAPA